MKLRVVLLLSFLMTTGHTYTMDYKGPIDPQMGSILHTVPAEIVPKFLWMDTTWAIVRTALALQQTCRHWHSILSKDKKKNLVSIWLNGGKDINENSCLCTALQEAGLSGLASHFTPEIFLFAGADVNHANEYGDTVLMYAIDADNYSISYIKLLIQMGARINEQNTEEKTALHFAVERESVQVVKVLLGHNANKTLRNQEGQTPSDLAVSLFPEELGLIDSYTNSIFRHDLAQIYDLLNPGAMVYANPVMQKSPISHES